MQLSSASVTCNQTLRKVEPAVEYGSIKRELHIDASPEVVFDVVSNPIHVQQWWADDADFTSAPGAQGELKFTGASGEKHVAHLTVVDAEPYRRFSFRWVYEEGVRPTEGNSLLVTFELEPSGTGTLLTMTESGFREMGWEAAVLEETYNDHVRGWGECLPKLGAYGNRLGSAS